ncbi:MAG: ice-binding family protein [Rhodoplanes sp.]
MLFVAVAPFSSMAHAQTRAVVLPVDLGSAAEFTILSKAGISNTGDTTIFGHLGVSPIASTAVTGFGLQMDPGGRYSTSSLVSGRIYAANYAAPTPSMLTTAIGDMHNAYLDAEGRQNPRVTEMGAGNIGGRTIKPGLYKWSSNVVIPDDVILSGGVNSVWIFQIAGTLAVSAGKQIILRDGAQAKNVFWQVGGGTTIRTTAVFNGNILGRTKIVLMTGARLNGRALAHTAVTLDANTIKKNSMSQ